MNLPNLKPQILWATVLTIGVLLVTFEVIHPLWLGLIPLDMWVGVLVVMYYRRKQHKDLTEWVNS